MPVIIIIRRAGPPVIVIIRRAGPPVIIIIIRRAGPHIETGTSSLEMTTTQSVTSDPLAER